ncbi:EamA family transporter [Oerskovia turbata]
MSALVALISGLLWGAADFVGGTLSKRLAAITVTAGSQVAGLAVLGVAAIATGSLVASPDAWIYGAAAGLCAFGALALMYHALATGVMGVVAPIIASSAVVPLGWGLIQGDSLTPLQVGGIAACFAGIVLVTVSPVREDSPPLDPSRRPIVYAVVGAVLFGASLALLAQGSATSSITTTVSMRLAASLVAVTAVLATRSGGGITRRDLGAFAVLGTLDASAYLAFGWASAAGQLSLVSVLSALYPVETAVLAYLIHRERLTALQLGGVVVCMSGVAILAL